MELLEEEIPSVDSEHFDSRENMVRFMNDMHNIVNTRLGKRVFTLQEHYEVFRPGPKSLSRSMNTLLLLILTMCTVGIICRSKRLYVCRSKEMV
jgi:hypothetical protein